MSAPRTTYCADCPDQESCDLGHPCDFVKAINDPKGIFIMNANGTNGAKNRKTDELLNQAQEFIEGSDKVPAQKNNEADGDALDSDITEDEDGESTDGSKKAPSRLDKAKDLARRNKRPILFGVAATGVITMVSMARYFANKNAAVEIETEIPLLTVTETITES